MHGVYIGIVETDDTNQELYYRLAGVVGSQVQKITDGSTCLWYISLSTENGIRPP